MAIVKIGRRPLGWSHEFYNVVGETPFTVKELKEKLGDKYIPGFIFAELLDTKCIYVHSVGKTKDSRGWLVPERTYKLTREIIMYMENNNMIPRKVIRRMCTR